MIDQSVSQSISPRARRSAQELARDYGAEEVEEAYRVAAEQKARSPNAYAEKRWGERRERSGAAATQARRLKDICDRCELTHYYDNLTAWVGWALCNDCKRAVLTDSDRHSEATWDRRDKPTHAAQRVTAYWRSVEAGGRS